MKNIKSITQYAVAIVLGLGVVLGVSSLQAAWTTPPSSPPDGNVSAPLNVGLNTQSKLGQLLINTDTGNPYAVGLSVFGKALFNGTVQITSGSPGANKVLISDAQGNASWGTVDPEQSITHGMVVFSTAGNHSWTVPSGVTSIKITVIGGGGGSYKVNEFVSAGGGGMSQGFVNNIPSNSTVSMVVGAGGTSNTTSGPLPGSPSSAAVNGVTMVAGGGIANCAGGFACTNTPPAPQHVSSGGTINVNGSLNPDENDAPLGYSERTLWGQGACNISGAVIHGCSGAIIVEY